MKLTLDKARFDRDVRKLAAVMNVGLNDALTGQVKLMVRDCMKATPPFTPGKNWTEGFDAQKVAGESATAGQVRSIYEDIKKLRIYSQIKLGKAGRAGSYLRKLIADGDTSAATTLLNKLKIRTAGIVGEASSASHRAARDRRGRIQNPKNHRMFVMRAGSIERLAARKVANVGMAKSGWVTAARALKLPVSRWIKKHNGAGIFHRSGTADKPAITVANAVPFIQGTGQELGIVEWAFRNRLRNLPKQVERTLRAQARKARAT